MLLGWQIDSVLYLCCIGFGRLPGRHLKGAAYIHATWGRASSFKLETSQPAVFLKRYCVRALPLLIIRFLAPGRATVIFRLYL